MVIIKDIVKNAADQGIKLYLKNNKLAYICHRPPFPESLKKAIAQRKEEIVNFLKQEMTLDYASQSYENGVSVIPKINSQELQRLSFSQQRLWFLDQLQEGTPQYNIPAALKVKGPFDVDFAQQAVEDIITKHHTLRTVFIKHDESAVQQLLESFSFTIKKYNLSTFKKALQNKKIADLINQESTFVFDLSQDLMIKASHIILSDDKKNQQGVLIFNMHHIASDGWSIEIFVNEFLHRYQSLVNGHNSKMDELSIQYVDFAAWQRQSFDNGHFSKQLHYWKNQLKNIPLVHQLPLDHKRPLVDDHHGESLHTVLDAELSNNLQNLAQKHGLTLFMMLHAVLGLLFSRYSDQKEIVIGTPVANRATKELESLIGFFANTLVLRTSTNFTTLREYLAHVKQVNVDAQSNQEVPFEYLLESAQVQRNLQFNPLFQILFAMNKQRKVDVEIADLKFEAIHKGENFAKFDIDIIAYLEHSQINLNWTYKTSLFTAHTIQKLSGHLKQLLKSLVKNPETALKKIKILSSKEQHHLVHETNDNKKVNDDKLLLHHLFQKQAQNNPEAIAVQHGQSSISYAGLYHKVNNMAKSLQQQGIKHGDVVALCVDRSIDMIAALFAILKIGAIYITIDPIYPNKRKAFLLADSSAQYLLTNHQYKADWNSVHGLSTIELHLLEDNCQGNELNIEMELSPSTTDLAYLIYTSGSTGEPKGIMIEHRNAMAMVHWALSQYDDKMLDGVLASTSICFDIAVFEIFVPLSAGGRIVLVDSIMDLNKDMNNIALINTVPSAIKALMIEQEIPESVNTINLAGELLDQQLVDRLYDIGVSQVFDLYGPSEDTTYSTCALRQKNGCNTIGRPITNTSSYIVDADFNIMPKGCIGQLCLAGAGVARGYLNQPELTEQKFIENPFDKNRPRLYLTGDRASFLTDEQLAFHGRNDDQVKINGFRIELGEVAFQIQKTGLVSASHVVLTKTSLNKKRMIAYVVAHVDIDHQEERLKKEVFNRLKLTLPHYLIPHHIMILPTMPLTENGKIDTKKLPVIGNKSDDIILPSNDIESQLHKIWSELLNTPKSIFGITDNFFELGGDSILSIQLVSRAARSDIHFSVKEIFDAQTIQELAAISRRKKHSIADQSTCQGSAILLPIQHNFFENITEVNHYNQSVMLNVPETLGLKLLKRLFAQIIERHDVLRLKFVKINSRWQALFQSFSLEDLDERIQKVDWSCLTEKQQNKEKDIIQSSLNINEGVTFRAVLVDRGAHQGVRLMMVFHHLVIDAVSWRILFEDMNILYQQDQSETELKLATKTISYQQWTEFLYHSAEKNIFKKEVSYWQKAQRIAVWQNQKQAMDIPIEQKQVSLNLSSEVTQKLLKQCNQLYRTHINELLLTALALTMKQQFRHEAFRLDIETHGRENLSEYMDHSQTVGWFTVLYPLTINLHGHNNLRDIICAVKEINRGVPNNGIGFGVLKYYHQVKFLKDQPNSELVFNYLGQFDSSNEANNRFSIAQESTGKQQGSHPNHNMSLNGMVLEGQLSFTMTYVSQFYTEVFIKTFMQSFTTAINQVIDHCINHKKPRLTPSDFPIAHINQQDMDRYSALYQVQDIYPTTGTQQGLLFHSLLDVGSYVSQIEMKFSGLDVNLFKKAWQIIINRHSIFRTVFIGLDAENMHQLICQQADLPWIDIDFSEINNSEQLQQLNDLRLNDKSQGFNLNRAPLMRLTLIKLGQNRFQLLWSHHHALLDGWSMGVIYQDVIECYQSLAADQLPQLKKHHDFKHYIKWLQSVDQESSKIFWKDHLNQMDSSTLTPLSNQANVTDPADIVEHQFTLSQQQSQQLMGMAQQLKITPNVIIQVAWGLLLSKYNNNSTVMFGTTSSGRPAELPGVEYMVGLFINSIPAVIEFNGNLKVDELLKQYHQQSVKREVHSHLALHEINRLFSNKQIFNTLIVSENHSFRSESPYHQANNKLIVEEVKSFIKTNYQITVVSFFGERLSLRLEFQRQLMPYSARNQITTHFKRLLLALSQDSTKKLNAINMLNDGEHSLLIDKLNGKTIPRTNEDQFLSLFSRQVIANPDAHAVSFQQQKLTYVQLNALSNRLGHYLLECDISCGDRVGIYLDRSIAMLVAVIAVMKSGASYVALDQALPAERLSHMASDSEIKMLMVNAQLLEDFPLSGIDFLLMDDLHDDQWLSEFSDEALNITVSSNDEAYVLYTSGSTGIPKGVSISHGGLGNYLLHAQHYFEGGISGSIVSSPLCFDATITSIFTPLTIGADVEFLTESHVLLDELSDRLFKSTRPLLFKLTPSHLQAISYHENSHFSHQPHRLVVGGELFSKAILQKWQQKHLPHAIYYNEYGPTETVVGCCVYEIGPSSQVETTSVPIGQAIANTKLYVVNSEGQLQAHGASGELWIAGLGVSQGYVNQTQQTSQRFIQNPFGEGRIYKSGDLVHYDRNDQLHFLGRLDDQIKVRGYRIEPAEIESCLLSSKLVSHAHVTIKENEGASSQLLAYVVFFADQNITITDVKSHIEQYLPNHMIPSVWVVLDEIPLTVNGKVDKNALPSENNTSIEKAYVAPESETEKLLCQTWKKVLKIESVGINDNFFSIGGDSIYCIRIVSTLRSQGLLLTVQDFFNFPTIKQLSQKISTQQLDQSNDFLTQVTLDESDSLSEDEIETEI